MLDLALRTAFPLAPGHNRRGPVRDFSVWRLGLGVSVKPFRSRDISVWPLQSGNISVATFLYTNNNYICLFKWLYRQANCHFSWCYANFLWCCSEGINSLTSAMSRQPMLYPVAILRGGLGGPWPPQIFVWTQLAPQLCAQSRV